MLALSPGFSFFSLVRFCVGKLLANNQHIYWVVGFFVEIEGEMFEAI